MMTDTDTESGGTPGQSPPMLGIECSNDDCRAYTSIPYTIRAEATAPDGWEIDLCVRDGRVVVSESRCPDHSLDTHIEALADAQRNLATEMDETYWVASDMASGS